MGKPTPTEADAPHNCPHCGTSLLGDLIPEEHREHYIGHYWKREVGVEVPVLYDGIWYYRCPDCDGTWGGVRSLRSGAV